LPEVADKGAAGVIMERQRPQPELGRCGIIAVDNPREALGRLAGAYRSEFQLPVVVVGGSNGKTTTKELMASVLSQKLKTLWSEASYNNDIGVPLTLLKLDSCYQAAVVEAGTNHPGELAPLMRLIRPAFGVITCIGREHLEFFGDLAGVAKEEGALAEALPANGVLFLNGDSEWAEPIAARCQARVVRAGFDGRNDWRVLSVRPDKSGQVFRVAGPRPELAGEYRLALLGRHQALNALFAILAGAELGLSREEIEKGLAACAAPKMRLQLFELSSGVRLLDDCYNANADSMLAALQTLQDLPCKGRRVAVLGDMAELGTATEAAHAEIGKRAAELGVSQLFALGKMASVTARGARGAGLSRVLEFGDVEAAAAAVRSFVKPGDVVLLKASRSARLERVSELLRGVESAKKN
jgi:UDP-N-acetylmuramoyl-tripeptide--D-alanyl-D-alanine ligase